MKRSCSLVNIFKDPKYLKRGAVTEPTMRRNHANKNLKINTNSRNGIAFQGKKTANIATFTKR